MDEAIEDDDEPEEIDSERPELFAKRATNAETPPAFAVVDGDTLASVGVRLKEESSARLIESEQYALDKGLVFGAPTGKTGAEMIAIRKMGMKLTDDEIARQKDQQAEASRDRERSIAKDNRRRALTAAIIFMSFQFWAASMLIHFLLRKACPSTNISRSRILASGFAAAVVILGNALIAGRLGTDNWSAVASGFLLFFLAGALACFMFEWLRMVVTDAFYAKKSNAIRKRRLKYLARK